MSETHIDSRTRRTFFKEKKSDSEHFPQKEITTFFSTVGAHKYLPQSINFLSKEIVLTFQRSHFYKFILAFQAPAIVRIPYTDLKPKINKFFYTQ